MIRIFFRKKSRFVFAGLAVVTALLCFALAVVLIVKQEYGALIILFFPFVLSIVFALVAWIEQKSTLEFE